MTQTLDVPSRPGVFADAEQTVTGYAAGLRKALANYFDYRRTLAELRTLSMRQREDLGFAGHDIAEIARGAMRRA